MWPVVEDDVMDVEERRKSRSVSVRPYRHQSEGWKAEHSVYVGQDLTVARTLWPSQAPCFESPGCSRS